LAFPAAYYTPRWSPVNEFTVEDLAVWGRRTVQGLASAPSQWSRGTH